MKPISIILQPIKEWFKYNYKHDGGEFILALFFGLLIITSIVLITYGLIYK